MKYTSLFAAAVAASGGRASINRRVHVAVHRLRHQQFSLFCLSAGAWVMFALFVVPISVFADAAQTQPDMIQLENFEEYPRSAFPSRWKPHGDQDKAAQIYHVEEAEGNRFLRAHAATESIQIGLIHSVPPQQFPRLRWCWRVWQLPRGGDERRAATFDSAAGVYVLFDSRIAPRILKYVWSATVPTGARLTNPFYWRAKTIVLQSGPNALGQWREETINFYQDYRNLFEKEPGAVLGFALMTSADSTQSVAKADYDDFALLP